MPMFKVNAMPHAPLAPIKERLLLKRVNTIEDLAQLYSVLMAMIADGEVYEIEVWQDLKGGST